MTVPFGAIVLTDFPFTDLTATKRRPALVISTDNDRRTDILVAYITSVPRIESDAVPIAPTPQTGLKVPSMVRFDKIATISKDIIAGRLGFAAIPRGWQPTAPCFLGCSASESRN